MKHSLFPIIALFAFVACQTSPISVDLEEKEKSKSEQNELICSENTNSGDCALQLIDITYDLPVKECQVYDLLINIDTKFNAPAGLKDGSTTRIDWEFFPNGNAGFWILPIESTEQHEGLIRVAGCFTYGEQNTLKVTRTITDHDGIISNQISIDIPKPKEKNFITSTSSSSFEVISDSGMTY